MATNRWRGDAAAVAKVITLTVGSHVDADTFITTMNGKSITYTASGDTNNTVAAAIQALLAASLIPEFYEVVWTVSSAVITGTAKTPGIPFTVSKSGTGTYTLATPTASSGPNHGDLAANWSLGTLPDVGDDVLIDGGPDLLYLDNLAAAAYTTWRVKASFSGGKIGLPPFNKLGYYEYRARAWPMATTVPVTIGEGPGQGPSRVNINQTTALAATILKTGGRIDPNLPVVNIYGAASGTLTAAGSCDIGIAADDDTTSATVTTATIDGAVTLTLGKGGTITTLNQYDGNVIAWGTITTLNQKDGTAILYKNPTTVTNDGGTTDARFTGTLATATFRGPKSKLECGNDPRGRTITDHTFTGKAVLSDPDKSVTWTNAGTWDNDSAKLATFGVGQFSLKRS